MSFFKSFKRELGRNTGKWVSNKVFRDGWSTPYRFSRTGQKSADSGVRSKKSRRSEKAQEQAYTAQSAASPTNALLPELRAMDVADDAAQIVNQLEYLLGVLIEHQGGASENEKIRSVATSKYRIGLHRLEHQDPESFRYFDSEFKSFKRGKRRRLFFALLAFVVLWFLAYVASEM